ncbi:MAG: AI-2E family transporter [bacterium]|nr:AI-2E family transporter [bacterium]
MQTQRIEISAKTIVFIVLFLLSLGFLWVIRELLFSLFIAYILVSALKPPVKVIENKGIPRIIATSIVYLVFLFLIFNIFAIIIPPLLGEVTHLVSMLPLILKNVRTILPISFDANFLSQYVPNATTQLLDVVRGFFSNAFFVLSTLVIGFYLLLEENAIKKILLKFFEEKEIKHVLSIFEKAEKRMNGWFWGEIFLMTVIGTMTFIGLNLIGMKYALALAVLAGLLEVVPNIGPIVSLIPAFLIGISESYFLGISNIALYFIIQQFENHLIVPLVMKRAVGLSPLITLIGLIIGGKLAGVMGVLLAVPIILFIETVLLEFVKEKHPTV